MLRNRTGEHLDGWLDQVERSELPELQSFAAGVKKDKDAVRAGLTWWISNGMVGQAFLSCANASFMRCRKNQPVSKSGRTILLKDHQPGSVFVRKSPGNLSAKPWEQRSLHFSSPTEQP
jgi:hypothetical protein